jgi:hypothetical protein
MDTKRISATVAAILSTSMALRVPVEPAAPGGQPVLARRHDGQDAAEVQDGPEREVADVAQSLNVDILLGGQTAHFSLPQGPQFQPQIDYMGMPPVLRATVGK